MKNRSYIQFHRALKQQGIILGNVLSESGHIYDVTYVDGRRTTDKCCKIFINCTISQAISEYAIATQCYKKDHRHFMEISDLFSFTIQDDIFDCEKNCWAMVMEKGVPFKITPEPESISFYIRFLTDITQAVNTIHTLNFVHFDIKPDNIVINKNGNYCLIDFGISKAIDDGVINFYDISGSRYFMAPEVFKSELSRQADIYSIGTTARFILMNGVHEFNTHGKNIKQLCQLKKNMEPLRSNDKYIEQFLNIINRMSAYYLKDRYTSTDDILKELENFPVRQGIRLSTGR